MPKRKVFFSGKAALTCVIRNYPLSSHFFLGEVWRGENSIEYILCAGIHSFFCLFFPTVNAVNEVDWFR